MGRVRFYLTRNSLVLGLVFFAMLLAAINYDNNLVYLILFWLVALVIVSMVYSHRNLKAVEIKPGAIWPVFAGSELRFGLQVHNQSPQPLCALVVRAQLNGEEVAEVIDEIGPGDTEQILLVAEAPQRGLYRIGGVRVDSEFPLGVFGTSRESTLAQPYIVYPEPRGESPFPDIIYDARDQQSGQQSGGDDFDGVRAYRPGEPQRHIDWKAVARGLPLMVKQFTGGGSGRLWFPWQALDGLDMEARLSQLTYWIIQADEQNLEYGLILPDRRFEPGRGTEHRHELLRALAVYRQPSP
ncbi:MAG: DUF58 domain-containing protein [Verrucomicrobiota bacterium]